MKYLTERNIEGESTCIYFLLSNKINPEFWGHILSKIDNEDLHSNGKEFEPHVTVCYSPEANKKPRVREIFKFFRSCLPTEITFQEFDIFQNDEYDVLFMKAFKTTRLEKIKNKTLSIFGMESLHPEYVPHMTIAYLKSGEGEYYRNILNELIEFPKMVEVDSMVYSVSGYEKSYKLVYRKN